ncbi:MAG: N-acetyltransferase [Bacteroidales bacterium]|jgi:GNAT superfamily N-acetyltransferase|nr:N-acetyltransferase [Bacteroidales bacterium]
MSVTIQKVETKAQLKAFVKFPLELYKGCPFYVPNIYLDEMSALDPAKNPMSKYSKSAKFLAYKDGKIVGRVAAIINEIANRDWNHQEVRFGWIDFIDDKEVSKALIEAVIAFGKEYGMTQISGPLGFTDFDNEGCVVEGFDDISSFMLKYNYPYYGEHFEALGMAKVNDWLEYRIYVPDQLPEKVTRAAGLVAERYNLHVRKISKKQVRKEHYGQKIFDLVNRTYNVLFDFTVLPPEVIDNYVDTFLGLLDLKFVTLIENAEGKLVGLAVCMPSLAKAVKKGNGYLFPFGWWHLLKSMYVKHEEAIEMLLIAVDPEYQNRGVHAIIFQDLITNIAKGGFKYGESNAEMETNNKVQNLWGDYRKEFKRRRRVFSKEI